MSDIPSPKSSAAKTETYEVSEGQRKSTITCKIQGYEGVPTDAKMFANLILAQLKLLDAIGKNQQNKGNKLEPVVWCLTEAAVIDNIASFSITAVSKDWYKKTLADAKAKGDK